MDTTDHIRRKHENFEGRKWGSGDISAKGREKRRNTVRKPMGYYTENQWRGQKGLGSRDTFSAPRNRHSRRSHPLAVSTATDKRTRAAPAICTGVRASPIKTQEMSPAKIGSVVAVMEALTELTDRIPAT